MYRAHRLHHPGVTPREAWRVAASIIGGAKRHEGPAGVRGGVRAVMKGVAIGGVIS